MGLGMARKLWSDEEDTLLRELWAAGHSARQIAIRMNCGYSRNAIIGRVHRMELPGRARSGGQPADPNRIKKKRIRNHYRCGDHHAAEKINHHIIRKTRAQVTLTVVSNRGHGSQRFVSLTVPETELRCVDVDQLKLTTQQMNLGKQCEWIEGDDGLHCGQPVKEYSHYCGPHHFICRRPPEERPVGRTIKSSTRVLEVA